MLKSSTNPILHPRLSAAGVEKELQTLPHLTRNHAARVKETRRKCRDARKCDSAADAIGRLPASNEALHLAISGKFALWHVVPAAVRLAGQSIDQLRIATLGFNRDNIDELCAMIDAGRIGKAWLLCSHYFKGTSEEIYQHAEAEFAKRPGRARFFSVRTHAKLLLLKFADGRTLTVESSANLRSCKNIEQMTLIGCADLYAFHAGWIDELFAAVPLTPHQPRA